MPSETEVLTVNIPTVLGDKLRAKAQRKLLSKAALVRGVLLEAVEAGERGDIEKQIADESKRDLAMEEHAGGVADRECAVS